MADDKDLPKLDLLIKIMKMTTADNDNLVLVAVKRANALLDSMSADWDKLLRGKVTIIADPFEHTPDIGRGDRFDTRRTPAPPPPRPAPAPPPRPTAPPPPPPKPFTAIWMTNKYANRCTSCGVHVAVGQGQVAMLRDGGHWETYCSIDATRLRYGGPAGASPPPQPQPSSYYTTKRHSRAKRKPNPTSIYDIV